ncbi:hypothetical protein E2C01_068898 [Portunus trituberculatus]|uniref:Uncharacterized protein n=1 Tax=Portunus trituberculatus TaxID=210409 RepID=A0A5B7I0S1_PORTR|nr:hypothetical protein [Portunus trituberculatus]
MLSSPSRPLAVIPPLTCAIAIRFPQVDEGGAPSPRNEPLFTAAARGVTWFGGRGSGDRRWAGRVSAPAGMAGVGGGSTSR